MWHSFLSIGFPGIYYAFCTSLLSASFTLSDRALVRIPKFVYHGFKCVGDKEAVVINVPTLPYNSKEQDEYRVDAFDNDIPYDWMK